MVSKIAVSLCLILSSLAGVFSLSGSEAESQVSCPSLQEIELHNSYRMVFDREPDATGLSFWLENFGLYPVGHLNSSEPSSSNIAVWYQRLYNRSPSPSALTFWNSVPREDALRGIAVSDEATTLYREQTGCGSITPVSSEDRILQRIRETFPESPNHAVRIAWCESRYKLDAVGPDGNDLGLMQVRWSVHHRMLSASGITREDLFTLEGNLAAARLVYDESKAFRSDSWDAWTCNRLI